MKHYNTPQLKIRRITEDVITASPVTSVIDGDFVVDLYPEWLD